MPANSSSRNERKYLIIFNVLSFLGFFLVLVVLAPALFSSRIKRPRAWFGVMTSWLCYSISYLLLIGHQTGPKPSFGLCMLQAALVYATTPLCAASTMCFTFDFFFKMSTATTINGEVKAPKVAKTLKFFPWILAFAVAGEVILSVNDASKVQRNATNFYCHITSRVPSLVNVTIVVLCVLIIFPLQFYTGLLLYRNWNLFKGISHSRARIALSTFIRLALFSFLVSLSLVLTIFSAAPIHHPKLMTAWRLVLVAMPTFAALCFGAQKDIIGTWLFWRRKSIPMTSPENPREISSNYQ